MNTDDLDGRAIASLIAGIAALVLVMSATGKFLGVVGLAGGASAVCLALPVLRGTCELKKLAVTGTITGTIAVTLWLVITLGQAAFLLWNLVF